MKPSSHGPRVAQQPDGTVRQSQMVTTFGPGAMVDLLTDAVLVGGLDFWSYDRGFALPHIPEQRLRDAIVERFRDVGRELSKENPFRAPPVGNDREPSKFAGVQVLEFPHWFVCQNTRCRALQRKDGLELKSHRYWHQCEQKVKTECVPVRFVSACKRGHIDEFSWIGFAHSGAERCAAPSLTFQEGATGDFNDIRIVCACGKSAKLNATNGLELPCFGMRPWLGPEGKEDCKEHIRLLVRTASNSYFPQVVSALSIPDPAGDLHEQVRGVWDIVKTATKELLPAFRHVESVRIALQDYSDDDVLAAIKALHDDKPITQGLLRTAEFKQLVSSKPEAPGDLPPTGATFFARTVTPKGGLPTGIGRLVVAAKLREVVAQIGFTRLEPVSADLQGEYDLGVQTAALGLTTTWLLDRIRRAVDLDHLAAGIRDPRRRGIHRARRGTRARVGGSRRGASAGSATRGGLRGVGGRGGESAPIPGSAVLHAALAGASVDLSDQPRVRLRGERDPRANLLRAVASRPDPDGGDPAVDRHDGNRGDAGRAGRARAPAPRSPAARVRPGAALLERPGVFDPLARERSRRAIPRGRRVSRLPVHRRVQL